MLRVPTHLARPGMRLAAEVLHPTRGNVLLRWGFKLQKSIIEKLRELRIREVWVQYPGTDEIREFISPSILRKRGEVVTMVAELFDQVHRNAHVQLQFDEFHRVFRELVEAILADPTASAYIIEMGGYARNELRHSAEVCFLSLLLGIKLQAYLVNQRKRLSPKIARDVSCLALGGMLHDIGYMTIDKKVVDRYNKIGDQDDPEWRSHVKAGYELVNGAVRPAVAGIIAQHHQHFDGSGFPELEDDRGIRRGLIGNEIHVFARIVSVANQFDRLLNPGEGEPPPRVRALRQMLTAPLSARFDPVVLAALPQVVPAYPPGAILRLSNGEQVVVLKWHPPDPCRPLVQPLPEDAFDRLTSDNIEAMPPYDLRERTDLMIVEQDGQDVREDNFIVSKGVHHRWLSQRAEKQMMHNHQSCAGSGPANGVESPTGGPAAQESDPGSEAA